MKKTKQNKETINQQQQQEILEIKKQRKVKSVLDTAIFNMDTQEGPTL